MAIKIMMSAALNMSGTDLRGITFPKALDTLWLHITLCGKSRQKTNFLIEKQI